MKKLSALVIALVSTFFAFSQDSSVVNPVTDTIPQVVDTLPITNPEDLIEKNRKREQAEEQAQYSTAGTRRAFKRSPADPGGYRQLGWQKRQYQHYRTIQELQHVPDV